MIKNQKILYPNTENILKGNNIFNKVSTDFDKYVNEYKEIINKVSHISGERFEYFIKLRIALMKATLSRKISSQKSLRILDFGCGVGETEIYLKDCLPNARIFGIDTSAESIKAANKLQLDNVLFFTSESLVLTFEDDYFDLIYSNGTFHHIKHKKHIAIFEQLFRVLKTGGDLFIFENNPYNPLIIRAMKNNPFDKDANIVYPRYLKNILKNVGFQFNTINYYFFYPKWLKFLRFTEKYLRWLPIGAQYFMWATK